MEKTSYKYEVIHNTLQDLPGVFSITILCELAGVSRSGYYAWVKAAPVREKREAQDKADFELPETWLCQRCKEYLHGTPTPEPSGGNEHQKDPQTDEEVQPFLSNPKSESLPQDGKSNQDQ